MMLMLLVVPLVCRGHGLLLKMLLLLGPWRGCISKLDADAAAAAGALDRMYL